MGRNDFADIRTSELDLARMYAIGAMASLESGGALAQADNTSAETLIRTTIQVLANGAAVRDLDGVVQRNAGRVSQADVRAGRLGSNVLGDIIGTVELAKGSSNFNWLAAPPDQIKAYLVANGFDSVHAQRLMGGSAEKQAAAREDSGARFDGMAAARGDWSSKAGQDFMRGYAMQHGVSWAAGNPELLRLGPAAIDALAAVHLRKEMYDRLTKEADFKAKDVVTLSKFAKEKNVDVHDLGGAILEVNKELTAQQRQQHNKALMEFMRAKPEQVEAAERKLRETQDNLIRAKPTLAPKMKQEQKLLKMRGTEAATDLTAGKKAVRQASADAAGEAKFGGGAVAGSPSPTVAPGGDAKAKPKPAGGSAAP